ncbi:MAG: asparagine synthase (glutamine-hydrolyzing) [Nitrospina sp.]|jgi:asparagine synthase (glutamine-hydrolysing)|nr:asparagine synthase (glutamine-hydrolyzing) [Nitrospina sp.]
MCGIAGYLTLNGRASAGTLHQMLSTIEHRGPDGLSGFVDKQVALGTARLSIVDLEGGSQPALSENRDVCVVFNGEIYNYLEERDLLIQKGHLFSTNSEVETLLGLYTEFGPKFVERLNGQFAIAIWDGRNEALHLYRDRLGIRPLFWHRSNKGFIFASEIKSIFQHHEVAPRLNRQSIAETFRFWTNIADTSSFENIQQLPPGHHAIYKRRELIIDRYWNWPFPCEQKLLKLGSDEEYFEAFSEELSASISRRKMADVPIGVYLSGGIDSSVLALNLSEHMDGEILKTYSVTFANSDFDESSAQKIVARHLGVGNTEVLITEKSIGEVFPQVVWQAETPLFRTAPAPLFLLSRQVHEDNIKVVMTGEGADEVLLGYDLFRETAIRRFWSRAPNSDWRGSLLRRLYSYLPQYQNPRYFRMLLDFYKPHLSDKDDSHYAMAVRWANGAALESFFSEDMKSFIVANDPVQNLNAILPPSYIKSDDIDRAQWIESQSLLSNYLLSSQGDRMSMAHGVESRVPFLDHRFIEFCSRLPRKLKLRGLKDKFILRKTFAKKLPNEIINRPKVAYQAPDLKSFFVDGKAPEYVYDMLSPKRIRENGFFSETRVEQLLKKAESFKLDRVSTRDNMAFMLILSTMLLDEIFVRKTGEYKSDLKCTSKFKLV